MVGWDGIAGWDGLVMKANNLEEDAVAPAPAPQIHVVEDTTSDNRQALVAVPQEHVEDDLPSDVDGDEELFGRDPQLVAVP